MRITGLTGFLDVDTIVRQLMLVEQRPLLNLQQRRADLDAERAMWEKVQGQLNALKDALAPLADPATFEAHTATSSDPAVVTATASAGAAAASYLVIVDQLAAAHRVASKQYADPNADLGLSGTPTINGKAVTVTADMSLNEIAAAINGAGAGVRAYVIDGRLLLEAEQTGAANAITVSGDQSVLVGLGIIDDATGAFANELQAARDASFRVNGLALTRSSNTVSDVVSGVTFNLLAVSANPVTISIALDKQGIRAKAEAFTKAYNDLYRNLNELLAKGGAQQGNSLLMRLQDALRRLVTGLLGGDNGDYDHLAAVGIATKAGADVPVAERGLLELDATKFDAALDQDVAAVVRLFAGTAAADGFDGLAVRLRGEVLRYTDDGGLLDGLLDSVGDRIKDVDGRIRVMEERLVAKEEQLYIEFGRLEQALAALQSQQAWLTGMLAGLPTVPGRTG